MSFRELLLAIEFEVCLFGSLYGGIKLIGDYIIDKYFTKNKHHEHDSNK